MSSLKTTKKYNTVTFSFKIIFREQVGSAFQVRIGDEHVPCNKESCVMVRGMAVILDILALLPGAEVVERCGSIKAHNRSFLFEVKHKWGVTNKLGLHVTMI